MRRSRVPLMSDSIYRFNHEHGHHTWTTTIPEPYLIRHWFFWTKPGCHQCRLKFGNRAAWEYHWILNHMIEPTDETE